MSSRESARDETGMKMADLARVSGVPVATVKFYLREGLLPAGQRIGPTQARYGEAHLRRLRLIRALRDVGKVSVDGIRKICEQLDSPSASRTAVLGCIADAFGPGRESAAGSAVAIRAEADVDAYLAAAGLPHRGESSARRQLVTALVALREHVHPRLPTETFAPYIEALRALAAWEIATAQSPTAMGLTGEDDSTRLEAMVYGTLLFEPVLLAIRRLLHEHYSVTQEG